MKNSKTISTIFRKKRIAYTRNGKKTSNIQIGITLFLYKLSTQFFRVWWGFRG